MNLTKDERREINRRATELSQQAWAIYRDRLAALALAEKMRVGQLSPGFVNDKMPDIRDALLPADKPF